MLLSFVDLYPIGREPLHEALSFLLCACQPSIIYIYIYIYIYIHIHIGRIPTDIKMRKYVGEMTKGATPTCLLSRGSQLTVFPAHSLCKLRPYRRPPLPSQRVRPSISFVPLSVSAPAAPLRAVSATSAGRNRTFCGTGTRLIHRITLKALTRWRLPSQPLHSQPAHTSLSRI